MKAYKVTIRGMATQERIFKTEERAKKEIELIDKIAKRTKSKAVYGYKEIEITDFEYKQLID